MSSKKSKNKTVSEKIAAAFLPKALADPENDSENENLVKIADFDNEEDAPEFDNKPSDIRKRNTKLLSDLNDKYKGKVSSRRELAESDESGSGDDAESSEDEAGSVDSELANRTQSNGLESSDEDDEEQDSVASGEEESDGAAEEDTDAAESDDEDMEEQETDSDPAEDDDNDPDSKILAESNQNDEIQKGLAVQNQLKLWEKLLEIRIHSQKMLIKANSLPLPAGITELCAADNTFTTLLHEASRNVETLLENMLEMQRTLAEQYTETKTLFKSGRKRSTKSPTEPALKRLATTLNTDFEAFRPYRDSVLQKWDDRTKILTPGAGARKSNKSLSENFDVLKKIDAVLLNKSDLVTKSRTVKGTYRLFGTKLSDQVPADIENGPNPDDQTVVCREIYDDTDFYHQQLRELIEFKSNTSSNPAEMTKQFAELQKLRQKMKKKVDTRASKGRKIRYVVHNKLVNFMAPNSRSDWTDDSKEELYRSLFAT